ncbi:hypothetical protein ABH944_008557 [Caballeronia udeis]|uniref:Type IV secretion system coupling protein TraD DNA-binding domain-containing protein n=1 Tax=Caballeronia udeis TaxID=1232866 RepID=A0ABW8MXM9_9BURK
MRGFGFRAGTWIRLFITSTVWLIIYMLPGMQTYGLLCFSGWLLTEGFIMLSPNFGRWNRLQWQVTLGSIGALAFLLLGATHGFTVEESLLAFAVVLVGLFSAKPGWKRYRNRKRLKQAVERPIPEPLLVNGRKQVSAGELAAITTPNAGVFRVGGAPDENGNPTAAVPITRKAEVTCIGMVGPSGTGKSSAVKPNIRTVYDLDLSAYLLDPKGDMFEEFFDPTTDLVMNPLDARSPHWNFLRDVTAPEHAELIAQAFLPDDPNSSNKDWVGYARTFVTPLIRGMVADGDFRLEKFIEYCSVSTQAELTKVGYWKGSTSQVLLQPDNTKMFNNMRAVLADKAKIFEYEFPNAAAANHFTYPDGSVGPFSIRKWASAVPGHGNGRRIWFTYPQDQQPVLKTLYSFIFGLIINTHLVRKVSAQDLFCIFIDEWPTIGEINGIDKLMAIGRDSRLSTTLAWQSKGQLLEAFGEARTRALLDNIRTRIIYGCADDDSAKDASAWLGKYSERRWTRGASDSKSQQSSTSDGLTEHYVVDEPAVTIGELSSLDDLTAFIRVQLSPPAKVYIPLYEPRNKNPQPFRVPVPSKPFRRPAAPLSDGPPPDDEIPPWLQNDDDTDEPVTPDPSTKSKPNARRKRGYRSAHLDVE